MDRRGQQAMEFIMRYGWAFLVFAAGISAMAYFGVFSPKEAMISTCSFGAGIGCKDFKATDTTATLTLLNSFPEELTALTISFDGVGSCTAAMAPGQGQTWSAATCAGTVCNFTMTSGIVINGNEIGQFAFTSCPSFGKFAQVNVVVNYVQKGQIVTNQVLGKAELKVEY